MYPSYHNQRGSVLIVAIFTLVVLGGLATVMSKIEWSTKDTHTREFMSAQAWMLANSANEWALTQFYPLSGPFDLDAACSVIDGSRYGRTAQDVCSEATLTCKDTGDLNGIALYSVVSTATCGSGMYQVQRRQEVWVKEE